MLEMMQKHPEIIVHKVWKYRGLTLWITQQKRKVMRNYCAYVRTDKYIPEGNATYDLDVHGGLTYYKERQGSYTYGIDFGHAGDFELQFPPDNPLSLVFVNNWNVERVIPQCEKLADEIIAWGRNE